MMVTALNLASLLIVAVFAALIILMLFGYPPPGYFWGFAGREVDYGEEKGILYYKAWRRSVEIDVGGKRKEVVCYLLRDPATKWSKFYVDVWTLNGKVLSAVPMRFDKVNPNSQLQKFLINCKVPEGWEGLFFKERHFQTLIDQIQYQPLDPKILNGR